MNVRIAVADLTIGMHVSELDRPWLGTPFLFQGFIITTEEELHSLREYCAYVIIDIDQSDPILRTKLKSADLGLSTTGVKQQVKQNDTHASPFHTALYAAQEIHHRTRRFITTALSDARDGNPIKIHQAREFIGEIAENILINHNAMLWLTYLKQRDEYTLTHCINVAILAMNFARHLNMPRNELEMLGLGALLHDLGKMRIPDAILNKPGRLTPEEFAIMKTHPVEGHNLIKHDESLPMEVLDIVLHHHERISGKGYPDRHTGDQIALLTKIASIVDVYDAITSDRVYHDGLSPYTALQNIYKWTAEHFEKKLVEEFISCMGLYPAGSVVEFNQGQIGVVIGTTPKTRLRPIVLLLTDTTRQLLKTRVVINLATQEWSKDKERLEISKVHDPKTLGLNMKQIIEQEALTRHTHPIGLT